MRHAVDERLHRLPRQRPAALVHDGARDEHGHLLVLLLEECLDGEEGGLAVGRVEDGLHQEDVHAAVQEAADLLRVRVNQLVEC